MLLPDCKIVVRDLINIDPSNLASQGVTEPQDQSRDRKGADVRSPI